MGFVPMKKLLKQALSKGYAVPAFCVWNAEIIKTVLHVALKLNAPVIIMSGPGEFPLLEPSDLGRIAYGLIDKFNVSAALLLDHGNSLEQVEACLAAGYTSVMVDYSTKPYNENASMLRKVTLLAHPLGVTVEGEIGHVGKVDEITAEGKVSSTLTEPAEASSYVADTEVDALAVSIGNAHGIYTKYPHFDFDRLAELHEMVPVPLVLHGGSGTNDEDLQRVISLGIAKVNIASELIAAFRESLIAQWNAGKNLWAPTALAESMKSVSEVVERWIRKTNAAGRASSVE